MESPYRSIEDLASGDSEAGDRVKMDADELSKNLQKVLTMDKRHAFWETQPVQQYQNREGPIESPHSVAEVRSEPYKLPKYYEWCTCDVNCKDTMGEIYSLLSNNYVEDVESMFRFDYSIEFLQWALRPPGYFPCWHIGVRVEATKRLVAFITGIPAHIRIKDRTILMAEINFLCIHKKLRSKRLAPVLIKEVTRRVHLENIWQAVYTAGVMLPIPVVTCQYWHRPLNPKKLIDVGFSRLSPRMTMSRTIKLYRLPDKTVTPGFRPMERCDIRAVWRLLQHYLSQFVVALDVSEDDVEHWLLPVEHVVNSFVVEDPQLHSITDFCSFYTLSSTILGNRNHTMLKAAYSFYNVTTKTPLLQLMKDTLIVAKQKNYDVFNALDIMQNQSFLEELKFGPGDGDLHYYLYNYCLKSPMVPMELGLVLL